MRRDSTSLSRRLFGWLCLGVASAYALLLVLSWADSGWRADRIYDRLLRSAGLAMLERVQVSTGATGAPEIRVDLPAAAFDTLAFAADDRIFYRLRTGEGVEMTGEPSLPIGEAPPPGPPDIRTITWSGEPVRLLVQTRILLTEQGVQHVTLALGQTRTARTAEALQVFGWTALRLTLMAALCLVLVPLATRRALMPLRGLGRGLDARRPEDLGPVPEPVPQEVRGLVSALNRFMARLVSSQRRNERFIADVAHQMRTGINAVDAQLQLATDAKGVDTERLQAARTETARTMRLTNQLLSHAMVIHRADAQPETRLDPQALLRDLLVDLLSTPRFSAVDLTFDDSGLPTPAPVILGDPVSLREALRNLLDNAITHGAPDVAITVTLAATDDSVTLTVADDGPGLPEAARARAVERFRTGATSGGSGLGLAIVAEVAQAHGARLTLADGPAGGLAVSLTFPRARPAPEKPDPARRRLLTGIGAATLALPFVARAAAAGTPVRIWSATDTAAFQPLIEAFNRQHPEIALSYRNFETRTLHRAVRGGTGQPDLVISLALDLQVDLVNRGLARSLPGLPAGPASWRRELFGFTLEPEAMILNSAVFDHLPEPHSHADLADLIRDHADVLSGRLGTYDIRRSGIGYLLSTQASALGPDHARLTEIMGQTGARLFGTTGDMVAATAEGPLALAVGALGPYANAALQGDPRARILLFDDYNLAVPRTGFVHRDAAQPEAAEAFLGFLLSPAGQRVLETVPDLAPLTGPAWLTARQRASLRRMSPGPGLLLWQDRMKRETFVEDWAHSIGAGEMQP